jgi:flagellar operon protein
MQINQYDTNLRLLEIAGRNKVQSQAKTEKSESKDAKSTFADELGKASNLNFSKHASARIFSRGIDMSPAKLEQLAGAVDKAAGKGAREALILDDNAAYVVSVQNRTVISAFSRENLREGVFTSIDSAVIL